jgi:hypothetical protein
LLVAGFARCKTGRVLMRALSSRDILLATRLPHPISESANQAFTCGAGFRRKTL